MQLIRRLNTSYQKVTRDRHIKASNLSLNDADYRLWDLMIALYDWDIKHTETFETVRATDRELAKILKWSPSKVCRVRNRLIKKGLLVEMGVSWYKVQDIAQLQYEISPVKQETSQMQQNQGRNRLTSIVSYKDKYIKTIHTEEEYKEMEASGQFPTMDISDMKWADENVE